MKRILSVLLALVMVIGMLPVSILSASAANGIYKKTTSIAVDDQVVFVCEGADGGPVEMTSVGSYGSGTAFTGNPAGTLAFNVTTGASEGTFAFVNNGKYVQWTGKNNLYLVDTLDANSSWTVSFDDSGNAVILNSADNSRKLRWNASSPRFAAYTSEQTSIQLYKYEEVSCDHLDTEKTTLTVDATCEDTGYTTVTCACGVVVEKTEFPALGHNLVAGEVTDPDCINAGYTTYSCDREGCDYSEKKDPIEALGHSFSGGTCSVCGATEGSIEKASSIGVGDIVVIVSETAVMELTAISTTSTKYGVGTAYTDTPAGIWQWEVVAGSAVGTFAFKNSDNKYLYWGSGNSLNVGSTLENKTSWTVSFDANGNATMKNVYDNNRILYWNSNSPRFACYTDKSSDSKYYLPQIYKISASEGACEHSWSDWTVVTPATCTANGEQSRTCSLCNEVETAAIPTVSHNLADGVCTMCKTEFYAAATTLNAYDNVVIYYPVAGVALTATASGSKLTGDSVSVDENGLALTDGVAVMQAQYLAGSTTDFYLICDNKYLTSGATGNSLTFATEVSDYAVWYLEVADETNGLVYIHSRNAAYSGNSQSLEYYNGFTTYGTKTTDVYKFRLYTKAGEVPTCEHVWSDWEIVETATCTTEGQEKSVCTLNCGEVKFQTVPATGHTYNFAETAVSCDVCNWTTTKTDIGDLPSVAGDTLYYFEGIVTYVDGRNVYMEDATGGICVYYAFNEQKDVALGDIIRVCDTLTVYNDLVETTNTLYAETQKVSSGNALPNKIVTVAELLTDAAADRNLLGTRVTLNKMTVGEIVSSGNTTVTDANGDATVIRYMPTVDGVVQGSVVNMTAIVSIYRGTYQLYINESTAAQDVVLYVPVAKIEDVEYTSFADAYTAATEGQTIELLAEITVDAGSVLDKNVVIDLNGNTFNVIDETITGAVVVNDNATASFADGETGTLNDNGEIKVAAAEGYLAIYDDAEEYYTFHAYQVKLTHVSLDPTNDALGYKAQLLGDSKVQAAVTSYGFNMGVVGGVMKTFTKNAENFDGIFSLRLQNIMKANGGEMAIQAEAFVNFANVTDPVKSDSHSTTMRDTILAVNDMTLEDPQKAAVYALYDKYSEEMDAWFTETGKTNNIVSWNPTQA